MEKRKRIEELVELLNKANYAYEQENREIMSNFEYDALYDELKALEALERKEGKSKLENN